MHKQLAIGIDLGGTHIKYALVSKEGDVLWEGKKPTEAEKGRESMIQRLAECVMDAKESAKTIGEVACVGIGTSGLVDIERGFVMGGAPNLPDWENLPLADLISDRVELPVYVDNDANLMGLGEYIFGLKGQGKNLIFLTIGTGIGGAMIINGDLYRGSRYAGAELGCMPMILNGETWYWEEFASTAVMVSQYESKLKEKPGYPVDGKFIVEAYLKDEPLAVEVMDEHFRLVGMGVAGLINIFNPENIVIGGGISEAGKFYIDKIAAAAEKHAMEDCYRGVEISAAQLGNKAGFLGAAYFALSQLKN
ncbi:MAG: ROK family protein [Cyclobacteriaceae bacterium]|nr:ROK family protein [Cyclobacteriaceae bacterium]